jgi:hypothetical protein
MKPSIPLRILRALPWVIGGSMLWSTVLNVPLLAPLVPSVNRTLYFKLPIEGVRFHWEFLNRDDFLAGELTLRIINGERDHTYVVFRDGKISDGWATIGDADRDGRHYFGFSTDHRVLTAPDDSLIITLTVVKDLLGQGPHREGILPAGTWQSTGTYSGLWGGLLNPMQAVALGFGPPVAFMECWDNVWPIRITKQEGWHGAKPAEDDVSPFRRFFPERGIDGRTCGSHV